MSMTITEKILAHASNKAAVKPGENIWVNVDILFTHDICGPGTIGIFQHEFGTHAKVWNRQKVILIPDHYIFTKDEKAHRNVNILREFASQQDITYFYEPDTPSYRGVCHVALPQEGHALPGTVIFGTDSHTCTHGAFGAFATGIGNTDAAFVMGTGKLLIKVPETQRFTLYGSKPEYIMAKDIILKIIGDIGVNGATYCAMEFCGETISSISMEERMTLCNMAVEAGAKNGIIAPDKRTFDYIRTRAKTEFTPLYGNPDAHISKDISIDIPGLEPVVAKPHSPANIALARQLGNVKLDSAYIGSCTGGKITDFQAVARILQNNHVCINTYLVPATQEVADDLSRKQINGQSLVDIFKNAGCLDIAPPSCAACLGGPPDTFGRTHGKEVVISTTNRNFLGRMGSRDSLIYLASPLTVAASAIRGYITDPRDFL